jgi:6-phosphogluconolactonase/glucosamine-6-phosphate isomerase/deaminase
MFSSFATPLLSIVGVLLMVVTSTDAFSRPAFCSTKRVATFARSPAAASCSLQASVGDKVFAPAAVDKVVVLEDAVAVGNAVRKIVGECAVAAIADHGYFALAIPGGSILKMLVGDDILTGDWTSKTIIAYVNHKCVPMEDADLATHAKARKLFMDKWKGVNVIVLDGTDDGAAEAASYEAKMKALSVEELPRDAAGLPVFDLALIGVGDDGHVGSLYPGRDEVLSGPDGVSTCAIDKYERPVLVVNLQGISLTDTFSSFSHCFLFKLLYSRGFCLSP